ncbi:hypothetical protein ACIG3E_23405 [Streptomyces sp. NPDC053474]|uniref:hypothetical protein n=1 Tax=Streptomyces sp. NPDC053474 TaxID=3365704 RepID=UPI0037CE47F2
MRLGHKSERSRRDAAVDVVVSLCGWLAGAVWTLGCARGWWWGGDLRHLPLIGDSAARAAAERRGWPWVPGLVMLVGALLIHRGWCAGVHRARGVPSSSSRRRGRCTRRFPVSGAR